MGYKFQGHCYETKQDFLDALSQTCTAPSGAAGLSSYFTVCTSNADTITVQAYSLTNGTPQTPFQITPQLISCSTDFSDAVAFGWQLALILAVGFGVRAIIKAFQ